MKRNTLYTVNKWNKPAFSSEKNLYSLGDTLNKFGDKLGGVFGGNKLIGENGNPTLAGGLVSAGAGLVGGLANSAISGSLGSGAGSAISSLGSTIGGAVGSVNPILGAGISIGSQVLGGVTNALFGESVDEAALAEANEGTAALNNFTSNASTFDEVKGPEVVANVKDVYKGGLFNDASGKNEELKRQRREAQLFADRSIGNNINNLISNQNSNLLANFSAYGGPLDFGGGALGIMQSDKYLAAIDNRTNALANRSNNTGAYSGGAKTFDFGGLKSAFLDEFGSDPIGAAIRYNQGLERLEAQREAEAVEAAREAEYNSMQQRLAGLETKNQGLEALLAAQPTVTVVPEVPEPSSTSSEAAPRTSYGNSNWDYIEDQLRKSGKFNDVQIEGIKYNLQRESGINPDVVGDNGQAYGLAQWHGARRPKDMSLEGQTKHLISTLLNYDNGMHWIGKNNYYGFLNARTPEEAHYYIAKGYERPAQRIVDKVKRDSDMSLKKLKKYERGGKKKTYADSHISEGAVTTNVEDRDRNYWSETINHGDTIYTFSPANRPAFIPSDKTERRAGEPATEEYLRLQQMYRNAREGAQEGNIGWNQTKDDVQDLYDWLAASPIGKGARVVAREAKKYWPFAFGGELGTNGTDFTNGLLYIDEGGTHEENPLEGVPIGLDPQGIPNLVEEGETVYNDYVFSDRMKVPGFMYKELGLGGVVKKKGKEMSFADASKKLAQESEQRPNDPISLAGLNASLSRLAEVQEAERMKHQAEEYRGLEGYACGGKMKNKFATGSQKRSSDNPYGPFVFDPTAAEEEVRRLRVEEGLAPKQESPITDEIRQAAAMQGYTPNETEIAVMRAGEHLADSSQRENDTYQPYDTWMRYAPAIGAGIMTVTDALGLTNRPDYTYADKLEAAAQRAGYAPNISYNPIGNYLTYRPLDIWFEQNRLNANARATDRAILNSGANQGSKAAALLASGYNDQLASGNLYRQAVESNIAQQHQVADFNRRTNMFNSQMGLEAAMANARYRQQAAQMGLSGLAQAAALREDIDKRIGASRSANLTNFLTSLGNIGRENFALNQINSDKSRNYRTDKKGVSTYKRTGK